MPPLSHNMTLHSHPQTGAHTTPTKILSLSLLRTHTLSIPLSHTRTQAHTHTLSHSLSLTLPLSLLHTLSLSLTHTPFLSLSLSHTHIHRIWRWIWNIGRWNQRNGRETKGRIGRFWKREKKQCIRTDCENNGMYFQYAHTYRACKYYLFIGDFLSIAFKHKWSICFLRLSFSRLHTPRHTYTLTHFPTLTPTTSPSLSPPHTHTHPHSHPHPHSNPYSYTLSPSHTHISQLLDCRNVANLFRGVPRSPDLYMSLQHVCSALKNKTRCLLPPHPMEDVVWENLSAKQMMIETFASTVGNRKSSY